MQTTLVAVGKRMPAWVTAGVAEYSKRLPPEFKLNIKEIQPAKRGKSQNTATLLADEAVRIRKAVPNDAHIIVLDEHGKLFSTKGLSDKMKDWAQTSQAVTFIIGGADGTDPTLKNSADEILSLSKLTLPHSLARLLFVEQYYRAWTILSNHPYHRE